MARCAPGVLPASRQQRRDRRRADSPAAERVLTGFHSCPSCAVSVRRTTSRSRTVPRSPDAGSVLRSMPFTTETSHGGRSGWWSPARRAPMILCSRESSALRADIYSRPKIWLSACEEAVGVGGVQVPEIGGEQRQLGVDVLAGLVPIDQRAHSERMSDLIR